MIPIKSEKEIAIMKEGGAILSRIMKDLLKRVKPDVSTNELNRAALTLLFDYKAESAFLGHEGFPAALCVSLNQVVVHGLPSDYKLRSGDVLSLDLGLKYKGYYADMAFTVIVGKKDDSHPLSGKFLQTGKLALDKVIKNAKIGHTLGDLGETVQKIAEAQGFNVARNLCGHGIGKDLHEEPQILNYGQAGEGLELTQGMVLCLEPMLAMGNGKIKKSADGFGYETVDGSLACHFEAMVAITKKGPLVLTPLEVRPSLFNF